MRCPTVCSCLILSMLFLILDCQYPENTKLPVFWIGNHFPDLIADPQFTAQIGFKPSGRSIPQDFKTVQYKGISLIKGDPHIYLIDIFDPSKATVVGNQLSDPPESA